MASAELPLPIAHDTTALRRRLAAAVAAVRAFADAETGRQALWAPVAIGAGAALYFSLRYEPASFVAPIAMAAATVAALLWARARALAGALALIAFGFAAADLRAAFVDAPALVRELRIGEVKGRLVSIDEAPGQRRLVIAVEAIERLEGQSLPARVRLNWRGAGFGVLPGDRISLRAALSPPPEPLAPGGFDYARQLYFQRIGAVGYAVTAPERLENSTRSFAARVETLRTSIARRIYESAPTASGAIVAAVVVGKRAAIDERTNNVFKDSGIAHLLSISGLHMALATGIIFFALRFALALVEPFALRFSIKKWAAVAALVSGALYLLLSGADFAARRAFIMSAIVFVAILADRRALSLRGVAIAAIIILLTTPEAVVHPGFQMSFAAVTALIAWYEWRAARADPDRNFTIAARARRYLFGIVATDVIAGLATAPFSLFHFARSANLGLFANLAAIPLMGFWVMPAAIIGLLLMPLGLDAGAWKVAASGVEAILGVAAAVAALPAAVTTLPHWPPSAIVILTLGGLWLCLQSAPWRLGGLAAIPIAVLLVAAHRPPALFVSPRGDNVAAIVGEGGERTLALFNPRKDKFAAKAWMEHAGLNARDAPTAMRETGRCDASGCVFRVAGATVAVASDPLQLSEDCARAALVVALYPVPDRRKAACAAQLIDRRDVWTSGAHSVFIEAGRLRVRTNGEAFGERPWSRRDG